MNKKSRSKSLCHQAIIFHQPGRDPLPSSAQLISRGKMRSKFPRQSPHDLFIVREAYQEPGDSDYVEEILMQRDYIID